MALAILAISMTLVMAITKAERNTEFGKVAKDCKTYRSVTGDMGNVKEVVDLFQPPGALNYQCSALLTAIIKSYKRGKTTAVDHGKWLAKKFLSANLLSLSPS